jgi:cysteine desulfurase family protein (TIGR01976 family)
MTSPSRNEVRARFPALAGPDVLLDNAGGSQMPASAIDRMVQYATKLFVQYGADYARAKKATAVGVEAHELALDLVGGRDAGQVVIGPSTSVLVAMLADCYRRAFDAARPRIIVAEAGHEANVGPWVRLEREGWEVAWWKAGPDGRCSADALSRLLDRRTRIVAFPHVSNIVGAVEDVAGMTRMAHEAGARVVIDAVAYAPHRAMCAAQWGVDWYVFSTYKVYGPHMAVMFGSQGAMAELEGPNHFFIERGDVPYKFELGGVLHEGCAALLGTGEYLAWLGGDGGRKGIVRAYDRMAELEEPSQKRLLDYLATRSDIRVIGVPGAGPSRVPTISFVHKTRSSKEIALQANEAGLGIRYGHFYAYRLCQALGLDPQDGVVRASLVHYNTEEEVEKLITLLTAAL